MKFAALATLFETLEHTSSYNAMRASLKEFFSRTPKEEIKQITYLTLGQIAASFADVNLGMAEKMVLRSITHASNTPLGKIIQLYKKTGDVGKTAEVIGKKTGTLSVKTVFNTLHSIVQTTGAGSQDKKTKLLCELLSQATKIEARYLARLVLGQLRLGVGDKTILDALALAYLGTKDRSALEHAYMIHPDIGVIAQTLLSKGILGIKKITVKPGVPIQMMLCQRIENLSEIRERTGFPCAIEQKYDGERIQAHKIGQTVLLYSRRLENITHQFPEIVAAIKKINARNCIIEGEAVAIDKKGKMLPFQLMMQRRRKHGIAAYATHIPVSLRTFDLLYLNGKTMLLEDYPKRYKDLLRIMRPTINIELARRIICTDVNCIDEFFQHIVVEGGEGIVIKSLAHGSAYQAGNRGWNWIKWKPDYVKGMRDTFDLAIVGAYFGKGRRAGTYGALLCATYDESADTFLTFCKLGSGFTDQDLARFPKILPKIAHKNPRLEITKIMTPDVWIEPKIVVEVTGAEITKSPQHTCGYALRFPRFLRIREKKPEQATTIKEIKKMVRTKR